MLRQPGTRRTPHHLICHRTETRAIGKRKVPARSAARSSSVGGDLPGVSPFILDHTTAIAVRRVGGLLENARAGVDSTTKGSVAVFDVHIEKGSRRRTN